VGGGGEVKDSTENTMRAWRGELTFRPLDSIGGEGGGPLHGSALAPEVPHCGRQGVHPALPLAHEGDVGQVGAALPEGGAQQGVGAHLQQDGVLGDGMSRGGEEHPIAVAVHLQRSTGYPCLPIHFT